MGIDEIFTAIALAGSTMLVSPGALADHASCVHLADQVATALSSSTNSPNHNKAKADANNGHAACAADNYDMGVAYYQKALNLLAQK